MFDIISYAKLQGVKFDSLKIGRLFFELLYVKQ